MTQDAVIILCLKIALITGFASLAGWIAVYSALAPWWRNPVGRTLVAKTALIAALFVPSALSLFFRLSVRDSRIAGWADVVLIGLVTPVMLWRCLVFMRLRRLGRSGSGGEPEEER